jgi:hypothetical protein
VREEAHEVEDLREKEEEEVEVGVEKKQKW